MSFNADIKLIGETHDKGFPEESEKAPKTATGSVRGRSVRCSHDLCSKKLDLVAREIKCICSNTFCWKHRLPESHSCSNLQEHCERQRQALKEQLMGKIHKSGSDSDFYSPPGDFSF